MCIAQIFYFIIYYSYVSFYLILFYIFPKMDFIDLRSDTVTEPTDRMLKAMSEARVGDDVYGDDPTVNRLEEIAASMMGKQASLFVPSGTFGNQLAILTHTSRGDEVIIGQGNHIVQHETGAAAFIAGVQLRTASDRHGHLDLNEVSSLIRGEDIHHPSTGLICTENAHSDGTVLSLGEMESLYRLAASRNIPVHLDGARIFNAAACLGVDAKDIAAYCHSVMFCLSKGLCCPVGSVLCGSSDFINKARKLRKLMGGGLRQAGYLAACGVVALETMVTRLGQDHENAKYLARRLGEIEGIRVETGRLDINMVFLKIEVPGFCQDDFICYLLKNKIKVNSAMNGFFRMVTHYWIKRDDIDLAVDKISKYLDRKGEANG